MSGAAAQETSGLLQELEFVDAAVSQSIGLITGIQWLLREGRKDPSQPTFTAADVAGMLDLVKDQLADAINTNTEPA